MLDFGALPPEINSGRMYVGPGSGPLLAAAVAWDEVAAELQSVGASYRSIVESLTGAPWTGPSSLAMAAAAAPYTAWINATGGQAERAAAQAKLAVGAYETAFAATVPPPVIAANRALLMALVASNILGQNTAAIAAAEAQYLEMWAQDAAAMYEYAGSSATASQLTPFTEPPQTTDTSGTAMQAAAVSRTSAAASSDIGTQLSQLITSLPNALQSLATTTTAESAASLLPTIAVPAGVETDLAHFETILNTLVGQYAPFFGWSSLPGVAYLTFGNIYGMTQNAVGLQAYVAEATALGATSAPIADVMPQLGSAGLAESSISATAGRAALVGSMSVPQGWTQAAPAIKTLLSVLPSNAAAAPTSALAGEGAAFSQMALAGLAGRAVGATATGSTGGATAGSLGGVIAEADAAAVTIIVIPELDD